MVVIALQNGPQYIGRYLGLYPLGVKPIADNKKCWSYVFSLSLSLSLYFITFSVPLNLLQPHPIISLPVNKIPFKSSHFLFVCLLRRED